MQESFEDKGVEVGKTNQVTDFGTISGMMRNNVGTHEFSFRFRRFSRRGYAAFASLHSCVTIGVVSRDIADCQMSKSSAVVAAVIRLVDGCPVFGTGDAGHDIPVDAKMPCLLESFILTLVFHAGEALHPAGGYRIYSFAVSRTRCCTIFCGAAPCFFAFAHSGSPQESAAKFVAAQKFAADNVQLPEQTVQTCFLCLCYFTTKPVIL